MSKALATKNVAAVLLSLALVVSFAFAFATPAKADTMTDLQAQVQALLAQISTLQGGSSMAMSSSACHTFTQNLKKGSKGGEVMWIQQFLNSMPDTMVSVTGAGSKGNETSTFGPATMAAVIKFQNKYAADILTPVGLTKGTGNWFAGSRAKANALCAGSMEQAQVRELALEQARQSEAPLWSPLALSLQTLLPRKVHHEFRSLLSLSPTRLTRR